MSPKGTKCAPAAREAGEASGEKREKTPSNEHRLAPRNSRLLITGGAGFIGSNLVRHLLNKTDYEVLNVDKLTYAGNLQSLADVPIAPDYSRRRAYHPDAVVHLAAESHVDRSIDTPGDFIQTNILGTYNLRQASLRHYRTRSERRATSH